VVRVQQFQIADFTSPIHRPLYDEQRLAQPWSSARPER
jgi:hypothetical protein